MQAQPHHHSRHNPPLQAQSITVLDTITGTSHHCRHKPSPLQAQLIAIAGKSHNCRHNQLPRQSQPTSASANPYWHTPPLSVTRLIAGTARDGHPAYTAGRPISGPQSTCTRAAPVRAPWQWQNHAGKGPGSGSQSHLFQHLSRHSNQQVAWGGGEAGQDVVQGCAGKPTCHHFHR